MALILTWAKNDRTDLSVIFKSFLTPQLFIYDVWQPGYRGRSNTLLIRRWEIQRPIRTLVNIKKQGNIKIVGNCDVILYPLGVPGHAPCRVNSYFAKVGREFDYHAELRERKFHSMVSKRSISRVQVKWGLPRPSQIFLHKSVKYDMWGIVRVCILTLFTFSPKMAS